MKIIYLFCMITLIGCGNTKSMTVDNESDIVVKYYYGSVIITSADGTMPYGPPKQSLVKRTTHKSNNTITEYVIQGEEQFDTSLNREKESNIFDATDSKNTFSGQIIFTRGTEWNWTKWEYNIKMTDNSGEIVGSGTLDKKGIKTEKYFTDTNGNKIVKIIETLDEINEKEYNEKMLDTK